MEDGRGRRLTEQLQGRPPEGSVHPAAGEAPRRQCPPRCGQGPQKAMSTLCGQIGRGAWFLRPAPDTGRPGTLLTQHLRVCTWGGVHRTVLRVQPFPVDLLGGGGPSAPLSVQEKGEQRSPSTQEWSPRAPALTSPQGPLGPRHRGPESISTDCSTPGPLKDAPRLHPRATCTPSGEVDSGLGVSLGEAAKAGDSWPSRCLCQESQAQPAGEPQPRPHPPCPRPPRWPLGPLLWPPAGPLVLGSSSRPARSPAESAPRGRRGSRGNSTGTNRPLALVLTPHLENGDSVLAARGFRGPLPRNIQHTPTVWGFGPEPVPPSPRPAAGPPQPRC